MTLELSESNGHLRWADVLLVIIISWTMYNRMLHCQLLALCIRSRHTIYASKIAKCRNINRSPPHVYLQRRTTSVLCHLCFVSRETLWSHSPSYSTQRLSNSVTPFKAHHDDFVNHVIHDTWQNPTFFLWWKHRVMHFNCVLCIPLHGIARKNTLIRCINLGK